jgi:hypothetical protein
MMGDVVPPDSPRVLTYDVRACGAIDSIRILKKGNVVFAAPLPGPAEEDSAYLVRLSFGWDGIRSTQTTDWRIRASVQGGRLREAFPCFAGGKGSTEKVNAVERLEESEVVVSAFTSRLNAHPISELVLRLDGNSSTRVLVEAETQRAGFSGGCCLEAPVGRLCVRDEWGATSDVFSCPKLRLGQAHGSSEMEVTGEWTDPNPAPGDWYLLRVQQKNGHTAWSSPIWCGER